MNNGSTQPANGRLRIMVVEDDPDIGIILGQILGDEYEIVRAENGLEALERLNWYQPDLTIMDLMMPILDGFDTTRAIKKDNDYTAMPVMFLTARKDNQAVREALMAGGDVYLEKPFDPPELLTRLHDMIARNNLTPKPKTYTLEQIHNHFAVERDKTVDSAPPVSRGNTPLTEQLARAAAKPKSRVLLITESDAAASAIRQKMKNSFEILFAKDAEAALDKVLAYQPDILMMNLATPVFDGILFAHLLRVNRQYRIPVVALLSEAGEMHRRKEAEKAGAKLVHISLTDTESVENFLKSVSEDPDFHRQRKRLDYREILRREEPEDDDF